MWFGRQGGNCQGLYESRYYSLVCVTAGCDQSGHKVDLVQATCVIPYHLNKPLADMFQKSMKLGTHVRSEEVGSISMRMWPKNQKKNCYVGMLWIRLSSMIHIIVLWIFVFCHMRILMLPTSSDLTCVPSFMDFWNMSANGLFKWYGMTHVACTRSTLWPLWSHPAVTHTSE